MNQADDEALVREIKEGRISAFEILVRRYQGKVFGFAARITGVGDAAEVVQDTFLKVYRSIDTIDTSLRFTTLLFTIAKNTAISYVRKRKHTVPLTILDVADEDETVYEKIAREDTVRYVQRCLKKLDSKFQRVLRLYYFDDLSYEEISRKLKLPVNTVRTHIRRGKAALKRILEV